MIPAGPDQSELIHVSDVEGVRMISVLTDIDVVTTDALLQSLHDAAANHQRLILSLQRCDYCDSHGLAMLVALSRQSAGRLVIAASRRTRRLFEITGIDKLLDVAESTEGALLRLRSKGSEG